MAGIFGGLGDLVKGLSGIMPDDNPEVKLFKTQNEIKELKEKQEKVYANLGRQLFNRNQHTEAAAELDLLERNIRILEEKLAQTKGEQEAAEKKKAEEEAQRKAEEERRTCSACGFVNPEGTKFCQECGARINTASEKRICNSCGAEVPAGVRFCGECGAKTM